MRQILRVIIPALLLLVGAGIASAARADQANSLSLEMIQNLPDAATGPVNQYDWLIVADPGNLDTNGLPTVGKLPLTELPSVLGLAPNIALLGCVSNGPDCSSQWATGIAEDAPLIVPDGNFLVNTPTFNNVASLILWPGASFGGTYGSGSAAFSGNPNPGDTMSVAGQPFTFIALGSGADGCFSTPSLPFYYCEVQIQGSTAQTVLNTVAFLNGSNDPSLSTANYTVDGSNPDQIDIAAATKGVGGNSIQLGTTSSVITLSNSPTFFLAGGTGGVQVFGSVATVTTTSVANVGDTTINYTIVSGTPSAGQLASAQTVGGNECWCTTPYFANGTTLTGPTSTSASLTHPVQVMIPSGTKLYFTIAQPALVQGSQFFELLRMDDPSKWLNYHTVYPSGAETLLVQTQWSSAWSGGAVGSIVDIVQDNGQDAVFNAFGTYGSPTANIGSRNNIMLVCNKWGDGGCAAITARGNLHGGGNVGWEGFGGLGEIVTQYVGDADVPNIANAPYPQSNAPWFGAGRVFGEGVCADGVGFNLDGVAGPRNGTLSCSMVTMRYALFSDVPGIAHYGLLFSNEGYAATAAVAIGAENTGSNFHYGIDWGEPKAAISAYLKFINGKAFAAPYQSGLFFDDDSANTASGGLYRIVPLETRPGAGCPPGTQPLVIASTTGGAGAIANAIVSKQGTILQAYVVQGGTGYRANLVVQPNNTSATIAGCTTQPKFAFFVRQDYPALWVDESGTLDISGPSADNIVQIVSYANASGTLTVSSVPAAAAAATGSYTFNNGNPTNGETIVLYGVTWTFVSSGATGNQTNIQSTLAQTIQQLASDLNAANQTASINDAQYAASSSTVLGITYNIRNAAGNSYTLAAGTYGGTVSGSTLTGGVSSSIQIGNTLFYFVAASHTLPTEYEIPVGTDAASTATNIYNWLVNSNDGQVSKTLPTLNPGGGCATACVQLTSKTQGVDGNLIVLFSTTSAVTASGSNFLTGGAVTTAFTVDFNTGGGVQIGTIASGDEGFGTLDVEGAIYDNKHEIADASGNLYSAGAIAIESYTLGLAGNVTFPAAPASTQCLHMSSAGAVTATGSDCGSGGIASGDLVLAGAPQTGLAEVDGDCAVGAGGVWTAGSCGGGSPTNLALTGALGTPAAGTLLVAGASGVPTFAAAGEGAVFTSSTYGLSLMGDGTASDVTLFNKNGFAACLLVTGTGAFNCSNFNGTIGSTSPSPGSFTYVFLGSVMFENSTAPTVSGTGLGTSPSITGNTAAMDITVGTSPSAASFTITMGGGESASHGWVCHGSDITTQSTSVFVLKQVGASTSTAVMEMYSDAAAAAAPVASDHIRVGCAAY